MCELRQYERVLLTGELNVGWAKRQYKRANLHLALLVRVC
jgi:hypothetical protein